MAIGQVKLTSTAVQSQAPRLNENAFGRGIATALKGLASASEDYETSLDLLATAEEDRRIATRNFNDERRWAELQGEWDRAQIDHVNGAPEDGSGITNSLYEQRAQELDEFLATLEPEQAERYRTQAESVLQQLTTNMYATEYTLRSNYESGTVQSMVGDLTSEIMQGGGDADDAMVLVDQALANRLHFVKLLCSMCLAQSFSVNLFQHGLGLPLLVTGAIGKSWRQGWNRGSGAS